MMTAFNKAWGVVKKAEVHWTHEAGDCASCQKRETDHTHNIDETGDLGNAVCGECRRAIQIGDDEA